MESDVIAEKFKKLLLLIYNAEYDKAEREIEIISESFPIEANILRIKMFFWSGKYEDMESLIQKTLKFELTNVQKIRILLERSILNTFVHGEITKKSSEFFSQALSRFTNLDSIQNLNFLQAELEDYVSFGFLDNIEKRKSHLLLSAQLAKASDNYHYLILSIMHLGILYDGLGNYTEAIAKYNESLSYEHLLPHSAGISHAHDYLARIYRNQGKLNLAIEHATKALENRIVAGMEADIANSYWTLGSLYRINGDNNKALTLFQQSLSEYAKIADHPNQIINPLYYSVLTYLDMHDLQSAKNYLDQLEELIKINSTENNNINYQLALALYYKAHNRVKDKFQAQQLLEKILDREEISYDIQKTTYDIQKTAIVNLIELLVDEYRLYKDEDVRKNIESLITTLSVTARKNHEFPLLIKILVLKAKIALAQGDGIASQNLLQEAKDICKVQQLNSMQSYLEKEETLLDTMITDSISFSKQNESIFQKIEELNINDYLSKASSLLKNLDVE